MQRMDRLREAIADRYRFDRRIGRGGMSDVYLAQDIRHRRLVAIKVLRPEMAAVTRARFLREIRITANLTHPHILPLLDSGDDAGHLYYVMPYIEGGSLRHRLAAGGRMPIADAVPIAHEVAEALGSAHRHQVVHRDIKPENILLEEGHAVVADFGVARAVLAAGEPRLSASGVALGTPVYSSPEQAIAGQEIDGRSDIYSLGCVLFEMLVGDPPFTGGTTASIVREHIYVKPPSVTLMRPEVPDPLAETIGKALAKSPEDRFATADEFAAALHETQQSLTADRDVRR